jgi:hypothetical protein
MRLLAVLMMAVCLLSAPAQAQTTNTPASTAAEEHAWSFSVAAYTYALSDDRYYVQPTVIGNRDWLHLETRGNYEALNTVSVWMGVNFGGGKTLEWELTPMFGGVFGDTAGIAPGFKGSLGWRKLELYGESEYVVDANNGEDSFFYNWSELTLAPADWLRIGVVTQRTRAYQSDREIQRGLIAGVSFKRVNVTSYVFNPDKDTRFVFAVDLTF